MLFLRWIGRRGALLLTLLWWAIVLIELAAPLSVSLGLASGRWLYFALHPLCHQSPSRSFFIFGEKLGLCARCTGLFFGLAAFGTIASSFKIKRGFPLWAMLALSTPLVLDGLGQFFGFWNTGNLPRFITGFVCALGIIFWLYPLISNPQ